MKLVATFSLVMDREVEFRTNKEFSNHRFKGKLNQFFDERSGLLRRFLNQKIMKNMIQLCFLQLKLVSLVSSRIYKVRHLMMRIMVMLMVLFMSRTS